MRHVTAVVLALSLGLHWTLLQSVAWVSMVVQYSAEAPIAVALLRTFDGKHPCQICEVVQTGANAEREQSDRFSPEKQDVLFQSCCVVVNHPDLPVPVYPLSAFSSSSATAPPKPPPRQA